MIPEVKTSIVGPDGAVASFPQTSGGTPITVPNIVPAGYYLYLTGAFDNIATKTRGDGPLIALEKTDAGEETIEGQFLEHVYVLGGSVGSVGAKYDDWVSMEVHAHASAPGDRTTTHDGNANKAPTGLGFNIFTPAPGNDGDWNVDGSDMLAGEINRNLVPVPSTGGNTGYWNWDPESSPSITPVGNPAVPDGAYNLFDVALPLVRQANRLSCLIDGDIAPSTLKGKKILPHWMCKFTVSRSSQPGTLQTACRMTLARMKTL